MFTDCNYMLFIFYNFYLYCAFTFISFVRETNQIYMSDHQYVLSFNYTNLYIPVILWCPLVHVAQHFVFVHGVHGKKVRPYEIYSLMIIMHCSSMLLYDSVMVAKCHPKGTCKLVKTS